MESTSGEDAPKRNPLPSALVSNLESVLAARRPAAAEVSTAAAAGEAEASAPEDAPSGDGAPARPIVLLTCAGGIRSAGLAALVDALVTGARCDVHVCAPESDKPACGYSITIRETITATSVDFTGAKAFEISGTPVDCVSLALSGRLFPWSSPALVISGINTGPNCGFHSSAIAAAREALVYGVPSIAISLNWKKDETKDSDFKDAAQACLPLINAALDDIEKGTFLRGCLLNIGVPSAPSAIKGFKLTKQSGYSPAQSWQAVSASRPSSATHFMGMHQSLGIQLAQLGKDASAAAAARRVSGQRKAVEVESVATAGKQETREVVKKLFRAEFVERQHQGLDEDTDLRALENGFVSVTPLNVHGQVEPEIQAPASDWLSAAVSLEKEKEAAPATAEAHSAA
ncbi:acid phosphatase isoform X4 [Zea mays]|uniref:Acid phosphatase n=1 Tax=Zea mays TaxID=4577 RepID=B6SLG3_MAIZE|nr:acid phosphatase [Zea mays]XP_008672805.1 acid phosphatase isoform X4 [Zea mays]ACG25696.1 acid phosphatase [Zea mays]ACN25871.1 unknown [Zea mays]ONM38823.1 Survival protein SurE-like phosphatase/nucleotidase [Zea mays]ONM38826.1 Survival protein SurE-like phosphatase/nucleotidase [Zea mays]|eukprot:NP_001147148.1 acid phosphatase [Zea mays]